MLRPYRRNSILTGVGKPLQSDGGIPRQDSGNPCCLSYHASKCPFFSPLRQRQTAGNGFLCAFLCSLSILRGGKHGTDETQ